MAIDRRGRSSFCISSVIMAVALLFGVAQAIAQDAKLKAGTLVCKGDGEIGLILGSSEALKCTFEPVSGAKQAYAGTISKIGLDIGITGPNVIIWTVLYSTSGLPAGALGGTYGGVAADVAVGIGAGANILIGGNNNSVVLQPVSVKGETGLNLAIGIAGLTLRYTP